MFQTEMNEIAGPRQTAAQGLLRRLNYGLIAREIEENPEVAEDGKFEARRDYLGDLLEHWDTERLAPSSCRLRHVSLVVNGKPTGQVSIAQDCTPASGQGDMEVAA